MVFYAFVNVLFYVYFLNDLEAWLDVQFYYINIVIDSNLLEDEIQAIVRDTYWTSTFLSYVGELKLLDENTVFSINKHCASVEV